MSTPEPHQSPLFRPTPLGPLELRNRFIRSAAFEGMCPGGHPSPELEDYHRQVAAGGVGMTTVAYASVSSDGLTYEHQLLMREELVPELRRLTDTVHREGAAVALQLGHGGYFANAAVIGCRPVGPSSVYNTYGLTFSRQATAADLERIADDFARAARQAVAAGFDALEIQVGHGYLLSQFLSPFTNRRKDEWGGSLEHRLRYPVQVLRRVREAAGPGVAILAKVNLRDGFAGGLELEEAVEVARRLEGEVDALILSGGFVSKTPMFIMRGDVPFKEFYAGQSSWTKKIGILLVGRVMVRAFPFSEAYFLEEARRVRQAVRLPLVLVGGLRTLERMEAVVAEGFDFLALARPLIMEPDLVGRLERGEATASRCEPCNKCIGVMDKGPARCVLLEERSGAEG